MKLFSFGRAKHPVPEKPQTVSCKHPVSHQVPLREDPADYKKVTGITKGCAGRWTYQTVTQPDFR
ncbi:MAG: hypothetical protein Q8P22_14430 [Chloroflexota bacterium]|nr:hypothetical protein [Chloroflexota bacterium]